MNELLKGKTALVTGASRGIGRAVALALARAGADVAVNYFRREEEAQEVCAAIDALGRRCSPVQANVALSSDVGRLVQSVHEWLGEIAILVNNAGITRLQPLDQITEADWDEIFCAGGRASEPTDGTSPQ